VKREEAITYTRYGKQNRHVIWKKKTGTEDVLKLVWVLTEGRGGIRGGGVENRTQSRRMLCVKISETRPIPRERRLSPI